MIVSDDNIEFNDDEKGISVGIYPDPDKAGDWLTVHFILQEGPGREYHVKLGVHESEIVTALMDGADIAHITHAHMTPATGEE